MKKRCSLSKPTWSVSPTMINAALFRHKHQLWLRLLFLSFSSDNATVKNRLYEFSQIEFRHLKWIAAELFDNRIECGYGRDKTFSIEASTLSQLIERALSELQELSVAYGQSVLAERMRTDEAYILRYLQNVSSMDESAKEITVFDRKRLWPDAPLSPEQSDALTLFLFEESYKEYELILVYFYQQTRCTSHIESTSYQDLIDESHFHLRSFGEMMAKLGILALPRELHPKTYKIDQLENFLINGIGEEENAKEECRKLSALITEESLSSFFDFINYQESYHIEIMKRLLQEISWKR